jgi:hypothetical protein
MGEVGPGTGVLGELRAWFRNRLGKDRRSFDEKSPSIRLPIHISMAPDFLDHAFLDIVKELVMECAQQSIGQRLIVVVYPTFGSKGYP